jgi:hypothetical protein
MIFLPCAENIKKPHYPLDAGFTLSDDWDRVTRFVSQEEAKKVEDPKEKQDELQS